MVQQHSLISKLCLLTLHFPRLRIIWSRSLHATADIFRSLKTNQEEPDPVTAAAVGEQAALQIVTLVNATSCSRQAWLHSIASVSKAYVSSGGPPAAFGIVV